MRTPAPQSRPVSAASRVPPIAYPSTERDREPAERPDQEGAIDERDDRIVDQVAGVALARAAMGVDEEPADVGVGEPLERAPKTAVVPDVRAVRVALLVGVGVVLAVVRDP